MLQSNHPILFKKKIKQKNKQKNVVVFLKQASFFIYISSHGHIFEKLRYFCDDGTGGSNFVLKFVFDIQSQNVEVKVVTSQNV